MPTEHYGWLFGLNILLMMVVTFVNSRLVEGVGAKRMLLQYGLTVLPLAGALLIYNAWSQTGGLWGIVIPVVLFVGHISLVGANAADQPDGPLPQSAGHRLGAGGHPALRHRCPWWACWSTSIRPSPRCPWPSPSPAAVWARRSATGC